MSSMDRKSEKNAEYRFNITIRLITQVLMPGSRAGFKTFSLSKFGYYVTVSIPKIITEFWMQVKQHSQNVLCFSGIGMGSRRGNFLLFCLIGVLGHL